MFSKIANIAICPKQPNIQHLLLGRTSREGTGCADQSEAASNQGLQESGETENQNERRRPGKLLKSFLKAEL